MIQTARKGREMKTKLSITCPNCGEYELEVRKIRRGQSVEICRCGFPEKEKFIYVEEGVK
jgi:predicted RNA-binding Zn-ribbon protein involved in translation (DUF1610 family)